MKEKQPLKDYKTPQFQLIRQYEQNTMFFAASGGPTPAPKSAGATLSNISSW